MRTSQIWRGVEQSVLLGGTGAPALDYPELFLQYAAFHWARASLSVF